VRQEWDGGENDTGALKVILTGIASDAYRRTGSNRRPRPAPRSPELLLQDIFIGNLSFDSPEWRIIGGNLDRLFSRIAVRESLRSG
jgi:hypothetical protein